MYSYLYKEKTKFRIWQRSFEMLYVSQLHFSNASEKKDKMSSKASRFHNMDERMKAFVMFPRKGPYHQHTEQSRFVKILSSKLNSLKSI